MHSGFGGSHIFDTLIVCSVDVSVLRLGFRRWSSELKEEGRKHVKKEW